MLEITLRLGALLAFPVALSTPDNLDVNFHRILSDWGWQRSLVPTRPPVYLATADQPLRGKTVLDLTWRFHPGKHFFQEFTLETIQAGTFQGQTSTQTTKQVAVIRWTPQRRDKAGNWVIAHRIEALTISIMSAIGDNAVTHDSTRAGSPNNPLAKLLRPLVGTRWQTTIGPDMEILDITGFRPPQLNVTLNEPLLKESWNDTFGSEASLKRLLAAVFVPMPDTAVKRGRSWMGVGTFRLGPLGTCRTATKYTYWERQGKLDRISVATTRTRYQMPDRKTLAQLPFTINRVNLWLRPAPGVLLFDREKRRLSSLKISQKVQGSLYFVIEEEKQAVDFSHAQTLSVKIMDRYPPRK